MDIMNNLDVLGKIIVSDILLGGDNAILIGAACAGIASPALRKKAVIWGTAGAIGLRALFLSISTTIMAYQAITIMAALLLFWIGAKIIKGEDDSHNVNQEDNFWGAVKTIVIADAAMSIDNVIAVTGAAAGAGEHATAYAILGIVISIPIILFASNIMIKIMDRFPMVIVAGGAMLGWIGGEIIAKAPILKPFMDANLVPTLGSMHHAEMAVGVIGALLVVTLGYAMKNKANVEPTPA